MTTATTKITHSVHTLKTWDKCQKRFELDVIQHLHWPSNPQNFKLGQTIHTLLDYQAKQLPIDHLLASLNVEEKQAWNILSKSGWLEQPIIASEWPFSICIDDHWLYGRIDRIIKTDVDLTTLRNQSAKHSETERYLIIDWKTGTATPALPQEDWQTRIYLFAVYTLAGDLGLPITSPEQLAFAYIQVGKNDAPVQMITIPYSRKMHDETEATIKTLFKTIDAAKTYQLPQQCPDKFCPYNAICGIRTKFKPAN